MSDIVSTINCLNSVGRLTTQVQKRISKFNLSFVTYLFALDKTKKVYSKLLKKHTVEIHLSFFFLYFK